MEGAIVLYPSPAIGHLVSMVELGKLLLTHYPSLSIKILVGHPPYNTGSTAPYVSRVSAATPITFHHLPAVSLPPYLNTVSRHHEFLALEFLRLITPHVRQALLSISHASTILAFITDFFCSTSTLPVVRDLRIPAYCFFTSGGAFLSAFLYFPTIHQTTTQSMQDLNAYLDIPGVPPIQSSDMALPLQDRNDKVFEDFLNLAIDLPKLDGIIVNTFESLEARALKAVRDGLCLPNKPRPPPVCSIGPLIAADDRTGGDAQKHESLAWLNSQPSESVVFLCFGSLGLFSAQQLKEIAIGLERSGQRFLWVVRNPPTEDPDRRFLVPPEPDLESLLPEGFLERSMERGLVVKQWAPQIAVLNHDSVGGFVTHCGWNSALEAICAGKPMVAWPLYAEQRFNRVLLVEELKLALPMTEEEGGFVSAGEVERRVRELMESEEGRLMRERIKAKRREGMIALSEGGSSRVGLAELVESWKMA